MPTTFSVSSVCWSLRSAGLARTGRWGLRCPRVVAEALALGSSRLAAPVLVIVRPPSPRSIAPCRRIRSSVDDASMSPASRAARAAQRSTCSGTACVPVSRLVSYRTGIVGCRASCRQCIMQAGTANASSGLWIPIRIRTDGQRPADSFGRSSPQQVHLSTKHRRSRWIINHGRTRRRK